jgi:hypothetical protein
MCVARIANSTGKPIPVDSLQAELIKKLKQGSLNVVAAPTMTVLASRLALTSPNQGAVHALKCNFMLLTEVAQSSAVGRRADKGNAASHGATPAQKTTPELMIKFAIFKRDRNLLLNDTVPAPGDDPAHAAASALTAVAEKVIAHVK